MALASLHTRTFVDGQFDVNVDHILNRGSALAFAIKKAIFYPLGILGQMWYLIVSIPDPQGGGGGD